MNQLVYMMMQMQMQQAQMQQQANATTQQLLQQLAAAGGPRPPAAAGAVGGGAPAAAGGHGMRNMVRVRADVDWPQFDGKDVYYDVDDFVRDFKESACLRREVRAWRVMKGSRYFAAR